MTNPTPEEEAAFEAWYRGEYFPRTPTWLLIPKADLQRCFLAGRRSLPTPAIAAQIFTLFGHQP